jgi:hypothetical protein
MHQETGQVLASLSGIALLIGPVFASVAGWFVGAVFGLWLALRACK